MNIRNFQSGDEAVQVDIYNAAAQALPKFKAATVAEVQRRVKAGDFDPGQRFYAVESGRVVGYCLFNANGRVSYPWCLPGFEQAAVLLFIWVLEAARSAGISKVFAAYRGDWPVAHDFFLKRGFLRAREMVNFLIEILEMPTLTSRPSSAITPLKPSDVPMLLELMPHALRTAGKDTLHDQLFKNPYFSSDALFALRNRQGEVMAAAIMVYDAGYADPHALDAAMPCFRMGAFGTEGMQAKRIKGLFSFLGRPDGNLPVLGLDLMTEAAHRLRDRTEVTGLAAQVASDVPELLRFYERNFKRQGSFPVFEMLLSR